MTKKRPLNEKEVVATEKAIENDMVKLNDLKESMWFAEKTLEFQKAQRVYEDEVREYKRKVKDKQDEDMIRQLQEEITVISNSIDIYHDQLENGV